MSKYDIGDYIIMKSKIYDNKIYKIIGYKKEIFTIDFYMKYKKEIFTIDEYDIKCKININHFKFKKLRSIL
jgi:hypothetical protein